MSKRIWELDAARGLCILGMVAVHLVYDLSELYGPVSQAYPAEFRFVMDWGGVIFVVISGICVTFSRNSLKRGLIVFSCGMLVTAVTLGMAFMGFSADVVIYFGVLHCLGACMALWQGVKDLPRQGLTLLGIGFAAIGLWLQGEVWSFPWLIPLGFVTSTFASADYFPLLPYFGFFLLGAALGKTIYKEKKTLLPGVNSRALPLRFLRFCGRHSLLIYLLHQPVIAVLLWAL